MTEDGWNDNTWDEAHQRPDYEAVRIQPIVRKELLKKNENFWSTKANKFYLCGCHPFQQPALKPITYEIGNCSCNWSGEPPAG